MISRWVPQGARSRAVTLLLSSIHVGTVFALPVTGWLIQRYSWPLPFYLFGALGLVWASAWFKKTRSGWGIEPPAADAPRAIPWKRLLSLPCVWAVAVGHFCANWSFYMLIAWLPSYFKSTFGVNIVNAGALSTAPWLVAFVTANLAAALADKLLHAGWSTTRVRKLMQCGGLLGTALFLLLLADVSSVRAGLILMCCATGLLTCCLAGFGPNGLDIAPRYADVIFGISNTFATLPGIFGVIITGWLIDRTGSYSAPFLLSAGVSVFGALVFGLLASGDRKIV
jgi:ACS family sodium-dependent inorganic phosphate cotransporter